MSARQALRQNSKGTLIKTAQMLFDERETLLAASARRWKRKRAKAVLVAFALGVVLGWLAQPWLVGILPGL